MSALSPSSAASWSRRSAVMFASASHSSTSLPGESLTRRPAGVSRAGGVDHQEAAQLDPRSGQRGGIRLAVRGDVGGPLRRRQAREQRQQQTQLTDAGMGDQ
jgi:hypothetical protein